MHALRRRGQAKPHLAHDCVLTHPRPSSKVTPSWTLLPGGSLSHHPSPTQNITPSAQILWRASSETPPSPLAQCQPRTSPRTSQPSVLWEQPAGLPKNLAEKAPMWAGVLLSLKPKPRPWPPARISCLILSTPLAPRLGSAARATWASSRFLEHPDLSCLRLCLGSPAPPPFRLSLSRTFCDQPRH